MNATEIFGLIAQGVALIPVLVQAGQSIESTVEQLGTLAAAGVSGTPISASDLAAIRAQFDADLANFNAPIT